MTAKNILVAGICGCGKTTLGKALADRLDWRHIEADEFHSKENKDKMSKGIPLTDEDRLPWLNSLHEELCQQQNSVLSCSALKASYREILLRDLSALTIWLDISSEEAKRRVASRSDHYMSPLMVQSQLAAAELTEDALIVDAEIPTEKALERVLSHLAIPGS
jgi:gluconokinase